MLKRNYYFRTLIFWVVVVLAGSFTSATLSQLIYDMGSEFNQHDVEEILGVATFSVMFSAVLSLPVLGIHFALKVWNRRSDSGNKLWLINIVHLFLSMATFYVLMHLENESFRNYYWICAIVYTTLGQILWNVDFRIDPRVFKRMRHSLDLQF